MAGDFWHQLALNESGNRNIPQGVNATGTAFGPYQFTAPTWSDLVEKHPELGFTAADRYSPAAQRTMAETYGRDNAAYLRARGVYPSYAMVAVAHKVGPGGALQLARADPEATVGQVLPEAAAANPSWRSRKVGDFLKDGGGMFNQNDDIVTQALDQGVPQTQQWLQPVSVGDQGAGSDPGGWQLSPNPTVRAIQMKSIENAQMPAWDRAIAQMDQPTFDAIQRLLRLEGEGAELGMQMLRGQIDSSTLPDVDKSLLTNDAFTPESRNVYKFTRDVRTLDVVGKIDRPKRIETGDTVNVGGSELKTYVYDNDPQTVMADVQGRPTKVEDLMGPQQAQSQPMMTPTPATPATPATQPETYYGKRDKPKEVAPGDLPKVGQALQVVQGYNGMVGMLNDGFKGPGATLEGRISEAVRQYGGGDNKSGEPGMLLGGGPMGIIGGVLGLNLVDVGGKAALGHFTTNDNDMWHQYVSNYADARKRIETGQGGGESKTAIEETQKWRIDSGDSPDVAWQKLKEAHDYAQQQYDYWSAKGETSVPAPLPLPDKNTFVRSYLTTQKLKNVGGVTGEVAQRVLDAVGPTGAQGSAATANQAGQQLPPSFQQQPQAAQPIAPQGQAPQMPIIANPMMYRRLPSGATFMDTHGKVHVKP